MDANTTIHLRKLVPRRRRRSAMQIVIASLARMGNRPMTGIEFFFCGSIAGIAFAIVTIIALMQ